MACTVCSTCRLASTSTSTLLHQLLPRRTFTSTASSFDQNGWATKQFTQGTRIVDPENLLDQQQQLALLWDDLPSRAYREYDLDAERLHYRRLIEWQLPQLGQNYGQKKPYYPPEKARLRSTRIEYAFEPNHDSTPNAHLTSPIRPFLDLLETDAQRHKFKLLLDEYYDAKAGTITVECDRFPAFAQNLKWCSDQIDACLEEAKVDPEKFASVPIKQRKKSVREQKVTLRHFPSDWLPPVEERKRLRAELEGRIEAERIRAAELDVEVVSTEAMRPSAMKHVREEGTEQVRSELETVVDRRRMSAVEYDETPAGRKERGAFDPKKPMPVVGQDNI